MTSGDIEFVRGDDATFKATLKDDNGDAYNLTSCVLTLRVKRKRTHADGDALIDKVSSDVTEISIPTPTNGIAYIYFVPTDTLSRTDGEDLEVGFKYAYDLELVNSISKKYTILRGIFKVLQD